MAIDALVKPLLGVELFQGLKPLQITEIARRADRIVYKPGDVILRQDTQGDAAILLVSGEAVRLAGPFDADPTDEPLPSGSLLGEMAMLIETEHSSTIIARTAVRALRITRAALHEQMSEDQSLADHLVQRISKRLSAIAVTLREIDTRLSPPPPSAFPALAPATGSASHPALH
jgi:CRP-like cAMP-binding protein